MEPIVLLFMLGWMWIFCWIDEKINPRHDKNGVYREWHQDISDIIILIGFVTLLFVPPLVLAYFMK